MTAFNIKVVVNGLSYTSQHCPEKFRAECEEVADRDIQATGGSLQSLTNPMFDRMTDPAYQGFIDETAVGRRLQDYAFELAVQMLSLHEPVRHLQKEFATGVVIHIEQPGEDEKGIKLTDILLHSFDDRFGDKPLLVAGLGRRMTADFKIIHALSSFSGSPSLDIEIETDLGADDVIPLPYDPLSAYDGTWDDEDENFAGDADDISRKGLEIWEAVNRRHINQHAGIMPDLDEDAYLAAEDLFVLLVESGRHDLAHVTGITIKLDRLGGVEVVGSSGRVKRWGWWNRPTQEISL